MSYRVYGLILESAEPIPELLAARIPETDERFDVRFHRAAEHRRVPDPGAWFMHWRLPTGEPWLSAARDDSGYALRFHGLADFTLDERGREIVCTHASHDDSPETVRHLLIDHVLPLVLNLRGVEALHASAVLVGPGAIVFTGPSGAGKSTLAAEFSRAGDAVLADDCVPMFESDDGFRVLSAYPGLRLWSDALGLLCGSGTGAPVAGYTDKRRIVPDVANDGIDPREPRALRAVYVLDTQAGREITTSAPGPRDATIELVSRAFRFEIEDRAMLERQLDFFSRLASEVPVRRISIPRDLDRLPEVRAAILDDLSR